MKKRNIVLVTIDSVRADHCSFLGYRRETTPFIDKIAKKGLYFENAIAASVPTASSIFCAFTGSFPLVDSLSKNAEDWRKEINLRETLSLKLKKLGYFTAAVHKHPWASKYFGFDRGFDYFSSLSYAEKIEKKEKQRSIRTHFENIFDTLLRKGESVAWGSYYNEIIERVEKIKKPYFLWIFLLDTHWPYLPCRRYLRYTNSLLLPYLLYRYWWLGRKKMLYDKEIKVIKDAYDDSIRYADAFVKCLWNDLKNDDPIFIIHSDHGDGFGEHGFYYHIFDGRTSLYEELVHVPLVIYNADIKDVVEKPFSLRLLSLLILELLGTKDFSELNGVLNRDWVISKIVVNNLRTIAVRSKKYKFIYNKLGYELYNLENDPHEKNNIASRYPQITKEFKKIIKRHIKTEYEILKIRKKFR